MNLSSCSGFTATLQRDQVQTLLSRDPATALLYTGCGKGPYNSSTGCICVATDHYQWVSGTSSHGAAPQLERDATGLEDHGGTLYCPTCSQPRDHATMDQNTILPCDGWGDESIDALAMLRCCKLRNRQPTQVYQALQSNNYSFLRIVSFLLSTIIIVTTRVLRVPSLVMTQNNIISLGLESRGSSIQTHPDRSAIAASVLFS